MSKTPLVALFQALQKAEQFTAGFDDDVTQPADVTTLLADLRCQIALLQPSDAPKHQSLGTQGAGGRPSVAQAAKGAISHLFERIQRDPRLAWHFDPITRCMEELTRAQALLHGVGAEDFRKTYYATFSFGSPACSECGVPA